MLYFIISNLLSTDSILATILVLFFVFAICYGCGYYIASKLVIYTHGEFGTIGDPSIGFAIGFTFAFIGILGYWVYGKYLESQTPSRVPEY